MKTEERKQDVQAADKLRISLLITAVVVATLILTFGGFEILKRTLLVGKSMKVIHLFHAIRGVGSTVIVTFLLWWCVLRRSPSLFPIVSAESVYSHEDTGPAQNEILHFGLWFIRMRWIACIVAASLTIVSITMLHYLDYEVLGPLLILVTCLALSNIVYSIFLKLGWFPKIMLEIQIYVDLILLTAMLHLSGGIENPMIFVYIFHIIIGGILLTRRKCYAIVFIAAALFALMAFAEMGHLVHHTTLSIFPHPETSLSQGTDREQDEQHDSGEDSSVFHVAHDPGYVTSVVGLQFLFFALTAYFTTTIVAQLRSEENRAKSSRDRLEQVVQAAGAGLIILDRNLRPVWINNQIRTWFDLPDDPSSEGVNVFLREWSGSKDGPVAQTLRDGQLRVVEREVPLNEGGKKYFQVTIAPLVRHDGDIFEVVELVQDVTNRKTIEAEMMHSEKMRVLGVMAAGIAHEVGNPLASISTRLTLLQESEDPKFVLESLPVLQQQIGRIDRIVQGISHFARPVTRKWMACSINTLVDETVNMLRLHGAAKKCDISTTLSENIPTTMGVADQLNQVFLNLGINGLEAMSDGGQLTITTSLEHDSICISFSDTGKGMDRDLRSKLFDPFFSTKDSGLGLGLYIARSIVEAHGGSIAFIDGPSNGSLVTVRLPIRVQDDVTFDKHSITTS